MEYVENWSIPSGSAIIDRLEELYEVLEYCPNSRLAPLWRREIEELTRQLDYTG